MPYLEAIAGRVSGDQRIEESLNRRLAEQIMSQVWVIETNDGRRHYTLDKPVFLAADLGMFKCLVDFDLSTHNVNLRRSNVTSIGMAPHTSLAGEVSGLLAELRNDNWEQTFCSALRRIGRAQGVDPVPQVVLLYRTLHVGCQGSRCLANAFGKQLEQVNNCGIDPQPNWLDPDDSRAESAREQAGKLLAGLGDLDAAVKATMEDRDRLAGLHLGRRCRWVGWLCRENGQWQCLTKGPDNPGDERRGAGCRGTRLAGANPSPRRPRSPRAAALGCFPRGKSGDRPAPVVAGAVSGAPGVSRLSRSGQVRLSVEMSLYIRARPPAYAHRLEGPQHGPKPGIPYTMMIERD